MGPWGPQGLIKISPGAPGVRKNKGGKFWKIQVFGQEVSTIVAFLSLDPDVSTILNISIFRFPTILPDGKICFSF